MLIWGLAAAVPLGVALAAFVTPREVEYVETIMVRGKLRDVYDAIRFQERLMEWSAWPPETGSACAVEGVDGELGARTIFMQKNGNPFGYQEITGLEDESSVSFILKSKGPPHRPELHFHLTAVDSSTTRWVALPQRNHAPLQPDPAPRRHRALDPRDAPQGSRWPQALCRAAGNLHGRARQSGLA